MKTLTDIQFEINVPVSPEQAYQAISKVRQWWIRDTDGETTNLGDSFTTKMGDPAYVRFTVTEAQPGVRYAWHVEDCFLPWFEDKKEWNGTDVVFDIAATGDGSSIKLVHRGLNQNLECFEICNSGWEGHFTKDLYRLITEGIEIS